MQVGVSGPLTESTQISRDIDLSPGQPLPSSQSSGGLGVIGRRSISDLGAIGDSLSGYSMNSSAVHDQSYNYSMLEASYHKLPQPKDSERTRHYTPVWKCIILPFLNLRAYHLVYGLIVLSLLVVYRGILQ